HPVDLNGAGATQRYSATIFGTGDPEFIAQHPKQRHLGDDVDLMPGSVDRQLDHGDVSLADVCCSWSRPTVAETRCSRCQFIEQTSASSSRIKSKRHWFVLHIRTVATFCRNGFKCGTQVA